MTNICQCVTSSASTCTWNTMKSTRRTRALTSTNSCWMWWCRQCCPSKRTTSTVAFSFSILRSYSLWILRRHFFPFFTFFNIFIFYFQNITRRSSFRRWYPRFEIKHKRDEIRLVINSLAPHMKKSGGFVDWFFYDFAIFSDFVYVPAPKKKTRGRRSQSDKMQQIIEGK